MKADIALIGGKALDRVLAACILRRQGVSVFTELRNRKHAKAYRRAANETWRGEGGVADITDPIGFEMVTARAIDFNRT